MSEATMELKHCVVTRIHMACDVKKIPHVDRYQAIADMFVGVTEEIEGTPDTIKGMHVTRWLLGQTQIPHNALCILADKLGVQQKWLIEGKGARYAERLGLNGNEVDWTVEQRKMYDFDSGDQRNKALAWVLLHQHPEVVAEFCSSANGHDTRHMRVDIRVNDVELPVKKFDDLLGMLAAAMMSWKMREMGLDSVEKSAFTQSEKLLRNLHNETYDKLGELMRQMDMMSENIGTLNEMAWSSYNRDVLHSQGIFSVNMPDHPERYFDEERHGHSDRTRAIQLFTMMINGARDHLFRDGLKVSDLPKEHERLDKLARSIYHDLTEAEQVWCDANIAMSDFNKELQ